MITVEILIRGETEGDIEIALEEVSKKIALGYLVGRDANETGDYSFIVREQEEPA